MTKVFISYSRKDIAFIEQLAADLKLAGVDAWYDLTGLEGGSRWSREIEKAIKESQYVLVVLSLDAVESTWVEEEIIFARKLNKRIIPLLYKPCNIPLGFHTLNYIDVQGSNYSQNYQEILRALNIKSEIGDLGPKPPNRKKFLMWLGFIIVLALGFILSLSLRAIELMTEGLALRPNTVASNITPIPLLTDTSYDVLYNIDFESPVYVAGSQLASNEELNTIGKVLFGNPLVVNSFKTMDSQCLIFETKNEVASDYGYKYEQIQILLGRDYTFYTLSFDILYENLRVGEFNVFLDYSGESFPDNFDNIVFLSSNLYIDPNLQRGTWISQNEKYHITLNVDFSTHTISLYLNNGLTQTAELKNVADIRSIRFNLDDSESLATVALDNIQVAAR